MSAAVRRSGRFSDYWIEATPVNTMADITSATLSDPLAAVALDCLRHEVELLPPPIYAPASNQHKRRRQGVAVLAASLVMSVVFFEVVVRLVVAVGR